MPEIRRQAPDRIDHVPTTGTVGLPPSRRRRVRAVRFAILGAAAVAVLAGCEKPGPSVTVWAGNASVWTEASCWGTDPASPPTGVPTCSATTVQDALASPDAPSVAVTSDRTVGINVDPVVADNGWYPAIGTSKLVTAPITDTYYRFTFPAGQTFPEGGFPLEIVAVGAGTTPRGVWMFRLTDASTN